MRLFTYLKTFLCLALCLAFSATAEVAPPKTLYGFLNNAGSWSEGFNFDPYWGFYSITPTGEGGFQPISPVGYDYQWALQSEGGGAGIYDDGYYYCFTALGRYDNYKVQYSKVNTKTWETEKTGVVSGSNTAPVPVPVDMTVNPADGKIYAVCRTQLGSGNGNGGVLVTVDRETGEMTKIADLSYFFWTISCDSDGQMYGISTGSDYVRGTLYRISTGGQVEEVGPTGLAFYDIEQSATIDFRSGKMYLTHVGYIVNEDGSINYNYTTKGLYELDVKTGKATMLHAYGDGEVVTALSIPNSHPTAPDLISDLSFTPKENGSMTGVVTFTAPSLTYAQQPLSGTITGTLSLDDREVGIITTAAGQNFSQEITVDSEGKHVVTVVLNANGHDAVACTATGVFGNDAPMGVENLKLTASADATTAILTWDTPTASVNGGYFNPDDLRYTIVRYPDRTTVARTATGNSFTETIDMDYSRIYYVVTPYIESNTTLRGKAVRSNKEYIGKPWGMPYVEPFDTSASWESITVIDANEDGGEWGWEDPVWKYDEQYACAFFYHFMTVGPSDDWFITPKLALDSSKLYRITWQQYGYYDNGTPNHLQVYCGNAPTVDGMHKKIYDEVAFSTMTSVLTQSRYFAPNKGDSFIGFRDITPDANHFSVDNILIEECGSSAVPNVVNDLVASVIDRASGKVLISFTAPLINAAEEKLDCTMDIKLYRGTGEEPIKTFTNVTPGQTVTYEDTQAAPAVNAYRVVPENSVGTGLEASISIDLRAGCPQPVTNVKAVSLSPSQVLLTWNAPTARVDENGNEIDYTSLRYLVYRPLGGNEYDLIGRGLKECQFIDNNPTATCGDQQGVTSYYVACVNGDDESYATLSNPVYVGPAYPLPFAETWKDQIPVTSPWLSSSNGTASWIITSKGYVPLVDGQDGWGILSLEVNRELAGGQSAYWSPRIDLSGVKDAKLTFWMYGENTYDPTNDWISVAVDIEGKTQETTGVTFNPSKWAGWKKQTVDLTPYCGNDRVSIILIGNITNSPTDGERRIHLDNLEITGTPLDKDVRLTSFTGPTKVRETLENTYTVAIANVGGSDYENLPLYLYADGDLVAEKKIDYLSSEERMTVEFTYVAPDGSDDMIELTAEIAPVASEDAVPDNNAMSLSVAVQPLNLPYVTDLTGEYNEADGTVTMWWGLPSEAEFIETVDEGAEAYDAFSIAEVGAWTMYDGDGAVPFKFQDTAGNLLSWDNNDQPQAWMVFRPSDVTSDNTWQPHSGTQVFTSWAAAGTPNNDWLISPELSGEAQLISFYIRRLNERDSEERFNVYYSSTDTDPASFHSLNGDTPVSAGTEWELCFYALPEGAKYFAIQYVGYHQSALLLDDLQFEAYPTHLRVDGYNLYRDGVRVNESLIGRRRFVDENVNTTDKVQYTVCPVYGGIEAAPSNVFNMDPAGIMTPGDAGAIAVMSSRGAIHVINAQDKLASVFSIDGKTLFSGTMASGHETISIVPGIYIVTVADKSFKVIVR